MKKLEDLFEINVTEFPDYDGQTETVTDFEEAYSNLYDELHSLFSDSDLSIFHFLLALKVFSGNFLSKKSFIEQINQELKK